MKELLNSLTDTLNGLLPRLNKINEVLTLFEDEFKPEEIASMDFKTKMRMYSQLNGYHVEVLKTIQEVAQSDMNFSNEELTLIFLFRKLNKNSQSMLLTKLGEKV